MKSLRVAVIGSGWGQMHIDAFRRVKGVEVVALCDSNVARGSEVARNAKIPRFFREHGELLSEPDIDMVSIVTPPATHKEIALKTIFAKKNLILETPCGLNTREAKDLLESAKARDVKHAVAQQTRYLPGYVFAKELIEEDYLGTFLRGNVTMVMEQPWGMNGNWAADETKGGGILTDVAVNFIDALQWWFGPVEAVMADRHTLFPEVAIPAKAGKAPATQKWTTTADDAFVALLKFEHGGSAVLNFLSGARHDAGWTVALYGSRGSLVITSGSLSGRRQGESDFGPLEIPRRLELPDRPREPLMWALVRLMEGFIGQVRGERVETAPPNLADGAANLKVVDAIKRSSDDMMWVSV